MSSSERWGQIEGAVTEDAAKELIRRIFEAMDEYERLHRHPAEVVSLIRDEFLADLYAESFRWRLAAS